MAKKKGKRTNNMQKRPEQKKKSFWSNFFEPVPADDEIDPALANRQYGEPPEPPIQHLFSDEELEFSDEEDAKNLARLTWEDGEQVVPATPHPARATRTGQGVPSAKKTPTARGGEDAPIRLFDEENDDAGYDASARGETTRTRIFRTGSSATTRIHMNETEETLRTEEAQKKARAREAAERHEANVERKNRSKKRRAFAKKLFGNLAFVIFLLAVIVVALYYGFLLSDIVVLGNETYSQDYIVERSGLELGRHILFCDMDAAVAGIEEDPYLSVDSITYIFPSRIRIIVEERKEVAGIIGLDYNVIIDKNGYVLSMSGGTDLSGLLQVTGVTMTGFQLGERLGQGNDFTTATLIQIIEKLQEYALMDSISSIDMTTPLAITMTAKNGLTIHVGQSTDLDAKMDALYRLLPQFFAKSVYTGTLYLSAKGGTVYSPHTNVSYVTLEEAAANANTNTGGNDRDKDGDGNDDDTGLPIETPDASSAPATTTPAPVTNTGSDDFSG